MKKNKIVVTTLALLLCVFMSGCGNAKLKNGEQVVIKVGDSNITSDTLYKELKEKYAKDQIVNDIDKKIFDKMYKDDEDIEKQVNSQLSYIKSQYKNDFEKTIKSYGYADEDALKDELRLNYQRTKAVDDYVLKHIKEDEISKYYQDEYTGDISAKHILIKVKGATDKDGLSDEDAKKKAEGIIKKLDNGEDFSKLAKENSDDSGSAKNGGDLGYFNKGDMVKEFEDAAFKLKVNEYTKTPVKTSYGYHIILKTGEKEKPELTSSVKNDIKKKILEEKKNNDKTLTITTLDAIRKENKVKFKDSSLKRLYNEYIDSAIESAESSSNDATASASAQ